MGGMVSVMGSLVHFDGLMDVFLGQLVSLADFGTLKKNLGVIRRMSYQN